MSELIKNIVLGICAVSLLSGLCTAAVGGGRMKSAIKLVSAFAAAAVIIIPLSGGRSAVWSDEGGWKVSVSTLRQSDEIKLRAQQMCRDRVEEYIVQLGREEGIDCRCSADCRYEDGVFYLDSCRVYFPEGTDRSVRREFIARAARGLGTDEAYITEG